MRIPPSARKNRIGRRGFLGLASGALTGWAASASGFSALASDPSFPVGVGNDASPYAATMRAIAASGEWNPALLAGKRVLVKPNLVLAVPASTGIVTHPETVRAVVDLALAAGASQIQIIEGGNATEKFTAAGYDFFSGYDPSGRVALVDLDQQAEMLATVPGALVYPRIYVPQMVFGDDTFLISVAKMKVHNTTQVTLSMKNLFGLPMKDRYETETLPGRLVMHERGVSQTVIDLNKLRPVDFAVVDASLAMEGAGPWGGTTASLDLAVAGRNALAVDMACLDVMEVPLWRVQHLAAASQLGFGPATTGSVNVYGDPFVPYPIVMPPLRPIVSYPRALPNPFRVSSAGDVTLEYWVNQPCYTQVEIVRTSSIDTQVERVRLVRPWTLRPTGGEQLVWDGRDDAGTLVVPGVYSIRVVARGLNTNALVYSTGWLAASA